VVAVEKYWVDAGTCSEPLPNFAPTKVVVPLLVKVIPFPDESVALPLVSSNFQ